MSAAFFLKWSAFCSPASTSPAVCCTAIVVMATLVSPQPENNGLSGRELGTIGGQEKLLPPFHFIKLAINTWYSNLSHGLMEDWHLR